MYLIAVKTKLFSEAKFIIFTYLLKVIILVQMGVEYSAGYFHAFKT